MDWKCQECSQYFSWYDYRSVILTHSETRTSILNLEITRAHHLKRKRFSSFPEAPQKVLLNQLEKENHKIPTPIVKLPYPNFKVLISNFSKWLFRKSWNRNGNPKRGGTLLVSPSNLTNKIFSFPFLLRFCLSLFPVSLYLFLPFWY